MIKIKNLELKKKLLMGLITLSTTFTVGSINSLKVEAGSQIENEQTETATDENYIYYYSKVFNLNYDIVLDYFKNKTRNFTAYEWEHHAYIDSKSYDNRQIAIIYTIKEMYYNPSKYGFTKEEILEKNNYTPITSPEELIEKYSNIIGIDKKIPLSICYSECGSDTSSYNFVVRNNPGGLGSLSFENKEMGIIYFVILLKDGYGCTLDSDTSFLSRSAKKYCPPNPEHWTSMASTFYYNLEKNYYFYAPDVEEKIKDRKVLEKNRASK